MATYNPLEEGVYELKNSADDVDSITGAADDNSSDEDSDDEHSDGGDSGNDHDSNDDSHPPTENDEVDHKLMICGGIIVKDGGRRKVTASMINLPEQVTSSSSPVTARLHPDEETNKIIQEMIEKERIFVSRLLLLQEVKQIMQHTNSTHKFITQRDLQSLFPELDGIIALHKKHILGALEQKIAKAESKPAVPFFLPMGEIFKEAGQFFLLHKDLACKQHQTTSAITKLLTKHMHLRNNINALLDVLHANHLDLDILLAEPRTRLYNFKLIFERYIKQLKKLDSGNQDLKSAEDAHNAMAGVLEQIDSAMQKQKLLGILLKLRRKFHHLNIEIMRPNRELLAAAKFDVFDARSGTFRECQVYLLDDMLVLEEKKNWGCTGLEKAMVEIDVEDTIIVYACRGVIELRTGERTVAEQWKWTIERTRRDGHDNIAYMVEDPDFSLGRRAPRLQDITKVHTCGQCHRELKSKDKHHCEACGWVVCRSCCSDKKVALAFCVEWSEQRVCVNCWSRLRIDTWTAKTK